MLKILLKHIINVSTTAEMTTVTDNMLYTKTQPFNGENGQRQSQTKGNFRDLQLLFNILYNSTISDNKCNLF